MNSPIVSMSNVTKTFTRNKTTVEAVKSVSLQVHKGELLSLKGQSGCGKTTLLMIAGGLCTPDSGDISITGTSLGNLSEEKRTLFRAENIGFVFQKFHLIPYLTVVENILAPSLAFRKGSGHDRAEALAAQFGLEDRKNHLPAELSMGECQRTALARALFNDPPLILADEPTGNLDEINAAEVLGALKQYTNQGGSVLLVTHDSRAADYADRTLTMVRGALVTGIH